MGEEEAYFIGSMPMRMKTEIIGRSTFKVTVTSEEMDILDITFDEINETSSGTAAFFDFIITGIAVETDIDLSSEQLCIEAFRTADGCIFYISAPFADIPLPFPENENICAVFETEYPSDLLGASKQLSAFSDEIVESSLYCLKKKIRLAVRLPAKYLTAVRMIFGEYGSYLGRSECVLAATAEHFRLLWDKNAIERLSSL